jgi:hypothetical protein
MARFFERERGPSQVSVGNAPRFDIRWKTGVTAEVKLDVCAARTHNAAVEYWDSRRNAPSGILTTEADNWLHLVPEGDALRCYELETKRLLKLCIEKGVTRLGGDYGASVMKLIPLNDIAEAASRDFVLDYELVKSIRYW